MSLPQEDIITKLKGEKRLWIVSVLRAMGPEDAICCATLVPKNSLEHQRPKCIVGLYYNVSMEWK
jgi:hypothetical protein